MQIDLRLFENLPQHVYVFAVILAVLTVAFVLFFIVPSFVVSWRLSRVIKRVRGMEGRPPAEIGEAFGTKGVLRHLWREYSHTLHEQETTAPGSDPHVRWRSTVPAEALFRPEIVVDTPLRTEFFRHLPGLFTGVGIIGTFFGLLLGLRAFQVSENPVIVRDSLNSLLHGVYEAFLVSAVAIALAMIVTLIERLVIARLYAKVEKLVQALDSLFEAGAGEEYLARLVKASEASGDRNAALAAEFQAALREMNERQVAATTALTERLTQTIEVGLKQPLLDVAEGLRGLRTEQWGAVQGMLDQVMSGHTRQLQGRFGEQVTGIHALEATTIDTLTTAVTRLEQMAMNVESAGTRGASAMSERLERSLEAAEQRQRSMNDTMAEFVQQIRNVVAQSQGETQGRLQGTLDELSTRMATVIESLSRQVQATTDTSRQHHEALAGQTSRMVGEVGGQVSAIVDGVNRAANEMKAAVDAMQHTTNDAFVALNLGANTVSSAAADFAKAGEAVSGAIEKSDVVAERLAQAAQSVAGVSRGLTSVVTDYAGARDAIAQLVASLQGIVDQAKRETIVTEEIVARIERATAGLAEAQREAGTYLARVSDVIGDAHGAFSQGVRQTLEEVNKDFHRQLSESVRLLRVGIQELQAAVESVSR